jgi:hypothetical protein
MTSPNCVDPASDIINFYVTAMREAFDPDGACGPPDGGGWTDPANPVKFFAGDAAPLDAFNQFTAGNSECSAPFLWVRVMRRYRVSERLKRGTAFPPPAVDGGPCALPRALQIEIGVARCAVIELTPSWADYAAEAENSLDDSWRIENVLCALTGRLTHADYVIGIDAIVPYGPEGGVVAWTAVSYVQF